MLSRTQFSCQAMPISTPMSYEPLARHLHLQFHGHRNGRRLSCLARALVAFPTLHLQA